MSKLLEKRWVWAAALALAGVVAGGGGMVGTELATAADTIVGHQWPGGPMEKMPEGSVGGILFGVLLTLWIGEKLYKWMGRRRNGQRTRDKGPGAGAEHEAHAACLAMMLAPRFQVMEDCMRKEVPGLISKSLALELGPLLSQIDARRHDQANRMMEHLGEMERMLAVMEDRGRGQ